MFFVFFECFFVECRDGADFGDDFSRRDAGPDPVSELLHLQVGVRQATPLRVTFYQPESLARARPAEPIEFGSCLIAFETRPSEACVFTLEPCVAPFRTAAVKNEKVPAVESRPTASIVVLRPELGN